MSAYWPGDRLGGACTCTVGPSSTRAVATAASMSSNDGSGWAFIAVSGLARKFWTMTSCRCPYFRCCSRSARIVSARSSGVSPIPISNPEVNGIDSRPASSMVRSRTTGSLSGEFQCALPFSNSRVEVDSSIIPIDADTGLRVAMSVHDITPGSGAAAARSPR
jgi:hypothetical protein